MSSSFRRVIFNKILNITLLSSFLILSSCSSIDLSFFNGDTTPWDSSEGQSFKKSFIENCNKNLDDIRFSPKKAKDLYCDCMFQKIVLEYPTYGSLLPDLWEYRRRPFIFKAKRECGVWYPPPQ